MLLLHKAFSQENLPSLWSCCPGLGNLLCTACKASLQVVPQGLCDSLSTLETSPVPHSCAPQLCPMAHPGPLRK